MKIKIKNKIKKRKGFKNNRSYILFSRWKKRWKYFRKSKNGKKVY